MNYHYPFCSSEDFLNLKLIHVFGWLVFYSISTCVGYLMPNPAFYILYIYIYISYVQSILFIWGFSEPEIDPLIRWVLWHINPCGLFKAKSCFYILYILGSIPGCVLLKTLKMVLDTTFLKTQQYKVRIKGKVEQSRERSSALPYTSRVLVFANGSGDWGSIPDQVIPKTQKTEFDASLLNIQHYKVHIKGKVEQSRERSSTLP